MTTDEITKLNNLISMVAMCILDTEHAQFEIEDYLQDTLPRDLPQEVVEHITIIVLMGHWEVNHHYEENKAEQKEEEKFDWFTHKEVD